MAVPSERSFGQELNTWVQTIGILVAAAWGIYTFIYKEVVLPKSAPINISVNLQLKKIGPSNTQGSDKKKKLVAIEMRVSATNPSPRQVFLLPSVWIAYGYVDNASEEAFSTKTAADVLNSGLGQYVQKHAETTATPVVASGSLFPDTTLKPNETTMRTVIIYVPDRTYDRIEVNALMPTTSKESGLALAWKFEDNGVVSTVYRVGANNERTELEKNPDGSYAGLEYDLQMANSVSQVSLWQ